MELVISQIRDKTQDRVRNELYKLTPFSGVRYHIHTMQQEVIVRVWRQARTSVWRRAGQRLRKETK